MAKVMTIPVYTGELPYLTTSRMIGDHPTIACRAVSLPLSFRKKRAPSRVMAPFRSAAPTIRPAGRGKTENGIRLRGTG